MIDAPSSLRTRGTVKLARGDSFNLTSGNVVRNDNGRPRGVIVLPNALRANDLNALSRYFRDNSAR